MIPPDQHLISEECILTFESPAGIRPGYSKTGRERREASALVRTMLRMLRVAKIPSLNIPPTAIEAVAEELRGGDATKESIDDGVLRIKGRGGREYLFLLSELFMDDLPLQGDSSKKNWTGKCPS